MTETEMITAAELNCKDCTATALETMGFACLTTDVVYRLRMRLAVRWEHRLKFTQCGRVQQDDL